MIKTMQIVNLYMLLIMPIVEKIVMQQRSSDQLSAAAVYMQLFQLLTDCQAVFSYIHAMVIYCHASMLYMLFRPAKICGMQNIIRIFPYRIIKPALLLITPPKPLCPSLCTPLDAFMQLMMKYIIHKLFFQTPAYINVRISDDLS